ncbi:MAG: U32 family peptidase [Elusimicrobia bacterium]|nr:U32 family peptidase [Elusimicrobiota bacterium]
MIIVAGAKNFKEAEWLFSNGADEIYCGLVDIPNHRRDSLSIRDEREFFKIINLAKKKGKRSLLLINEAGAPDKYPKLAEKAKKIVERGVGGLVVKDVSLIEYLQNYGVKSYYILSSLALAFNSRTLEFFKKYNVKRVILPYHLPPAEAGKIIKNKCGIETEMFYYPSHFCQNVDPLCKFCDWSRDYKPCKIRLDSEGGYFTMPSPDASGLADIMYDGHRAGVQYLKIPRTLDFNGLKSFLGDARRLLCLLDGGVSRKEFRNFFKNVYSSSRV